MGSQELLEIFKNEAEEIIQNLESALLTLEDNPDDETINNLFRYLHTMKGSSGIAGFGEVSEFAHHVESLADKIRSGELAVSSDIIDILLRAVDWFKAKIFDPESGYDFELNRQLILDDLASIGNHIPVKEKKEELNVFRIRIKFREDIFEYGTDPLILLEDLYVSSDEIVEWNVSKEKLPDLDQMDPQKVYLCWKMIVKTKLSEKEITDIFLFVKDDNDIDIADITDSYEEDDDIDIVNENNRLGDLLLKKGIVTEDELNSILQLQDYKNKKLGELIVEKGFATKKDLDKALQVQGKIRNKIESSTVRVDTHKLDNLMNLLGEIVIGQSAITRYADELDDDTGYSLKNALYGLDRITREFQEQIMSIRMIPIGPTFGQFKRFVRDSSHKLGKSIKLEITGEDTELDKTVVEKISDPLKHMIRNSIDHGIESSEERVAAGKSEEGTIYLDAYHREGNVYIEIKDDGRGLDRKRIREKAVDKGLLGKDEEISDSRLISFIFHPGFSTAQQAGEFSGRGVGMDVVKNNIEALRGSVDVSSEEGRGSVFKIKMPLTLAIIDGMLFRVGSSTYIVPLLSIVESIQPKKEEVQTIEGKGEVVLVRGKYISLLRLYDFFSEEPDNKNPWESLLIIVEADGRHMALMIDDLIGQQQIVIKSLDNIITNKKSVSGAAILGDGKVALILDVHGLVKDFSFEGVAK